MTENKRIIKAFDPEEFKKIIEKLEQEDFRHLPGALQISQHRSYTAMCLISDELFARREWPDEMPRGVFLLFSTYDLVEVLKETFGLVEKSSESS